MAHDVFICHSADDRVVALAACAKLEARGIRCWIAPRDPIAGIPYPRQLVDAIGAAKAVLLIFSGKANESAHVLRELGEAADRNKPVIPLRTENVLPTGDLKYYIQSVHWLDAMTPPIESRLDELVALVQRILDMPTPSVEGVTVPPQTVESNASLAAPPAKRTHSARLALIASGVVIVLGLATVVILGIGRSHCATFTQDPTPTNVRDAPASSGLVLTTLKDGTKITVDAQDHGWSHISSPVRGWVFSGLTTVRCE